MKSLAMAAALLAASASGAAAQDFDGLYDVRGTTLDGTPYAGTAEIRFTDNATCEIYWSTGPMPAHGICMRYGPAFAAGYAMGDAIALVIYQIMDDGSLDGTWTISGQSGSGTEVLTPR